MTSLELLSVLFTRHAENQRSEGYITESDLNTTVTGVGRYCPSGNQSGTFTKQICGRFDPVVSMGWFQRGY